MATSKARRIRNPKGAGSISRMANGRWRVRFRSGLEGTAASEISRYADSRTEAEAIRAELQTQARKGARLQGGRNARTVADALAGHVERSTRTARATTMRTYRTFAQLAVEACGSVKLEALRTAHVERGLDALAKRGVGPTTCGHVVVLLRSALEAEVRDGHLHRNVAKYARVAGSSTARPASPFAPGEVARLIDVAMDLEPALVPVLVLGAQAGLRIGEALALRWSDLDLEAGTVSISRTLTRTSAAGMKGASRSWTFGKPKTVAGVRRVPLPGGAVAMLRTHRAQQAALRLANASVWTPLDLVVCGADGQPVHAPVRAFARVCTAAGLRTRRLHDLRASFASVAVEAVGPVEAARLLGHADGGRLLFSRYARATSGIDLVRDRLAAAFGPAGEGGEATVGPTNQ